MKVDSRRLAYLLLRATIGSVFLLYGVGKFLRGFTLVAEGMQKDFAATWLPASMVYLFGCLLPFAEVITGALLILGLFTRFAAVLAGLLILALTAGLTIAGNSTGVALNLVFAVALFILLYVIDENELSLDAKLRQNGRGGTG